MKSSEVHRIIKRNGWTLDRIKGSHYIYVKDSVIRVVPFHGSKEMGEGLRKNIDMGSHPGPWPPLERGRHMLAHKLY